MKRKIFFVFFAIFAANVYLCQTNVFGTLRICTEFDADSVSTTDTFAIDAAAKKKRMWETGRTLRVKFLGGDKYVQSKVIQYAVEWSKHCNIKFKFVTTGAAEIRVNFI